MVKVKRIGEHELPVPEVKSVYDAGIDLRTVEDFDLLPGETRVVPTGFAWQFPEGICGRISPRSGLAANYSIDVFGGICDENYRGEIKVVLHNHSRHPKMFYTGDRIAQMVLQLTIVPQVFEEVDELTDSDRGHKGFGSSGLA